MKASKKNIFIGNIKVILEGIGIVLSILIAFAIENWDEELKKDEKEAFYLESVYYDLEKDYRELEHRVSNYSIKLESTESILSQLHYDQPDYSLVFQTINENLTYNFSYIPFNHTYKALESSGDIKLIRDENLKILLFELDKSFYSTTLYGDIFLNYTNSVMWAGFLLNNAKYHEDGFSNNFNNSQVLKIQFANRVKRMHELIQTYYYNMQGTLTKIKYVKGVLEEILIFKQIEFNTFEIQRDEENTIEEDIEDELENLL